MDASFGGEEDLEAMDKSQLVELVHTLRLRMEQTKRETTKFESELRRELVSKWSKRVEDAEAYHE